MTATDVAVAARVVIALVLLASGLGKLVALPRSTARFRTDLGRYAWRVFALAADLPPGTHTVTSRATDSAGRVQEEVTEPNHRGYDYSGWRVLAVDVTVA